MGILSKIVNVFRGEPAPVAANQPQARPSSLAPEDELDPLKLSMKVQSTAAPPSAAGYRFPMGDDWLEVPSLKFYGYVHCSPDRQWIVALQDSDSKGRGGCRDSGYGRVVAIDLAKRLIATHLNTIARPTEAAISDVGVFVVNDCGFGMGLGADVQVFSQAGKRLLRRKFEANVEKVAISPCGRFIAVQTCNAPTGPDGNLLEVHDVVAGRALFSRHPETTWARAYEFETAGERLARLWTDHGPIGRFAYDASGKFEDSPGYLAARLERAEFGERIFAADELLKLDPSPEAAGRVIEAVMSALAAGAAERDDWAAHAYRTMGEALERLHRSEDALAAFDAALAKNPKIGVKRRADTLRKRLVAADTPAPKP